MQLARGHLDVPDIAELLELLRSARVLKHDLVDVEGLELAATEPVNRLGDVRDEFNEVRFVESRNCLSCLQTI